MIPSGSHNQTKPPQLSWRTLLTQRAIEWDLADITPSNDICGGARVRRRVSLHHFPKADATLFQTWGSLRWPRMEKPMIAGGTLQFVSM